MKYKIIIIYFFLGTISILIFLLGRVSIAWQQQPCTIKGVNITPPPKIQEFIISLENYNKKDDHPPTELEIFKEITQNQSKQDAKFVASKLGKYYYPLNHPKADGLTEKNRVYFSSEIDAQNNGYSSGTK